MIKGVITTQVKKLSFLIAVLVLSLLGSIPVFAADTPATEAVIETNAYGEVEADPDIAYLNIQVRTEESSSELSQQANAKAVTQVIETLTANGITKTEIYTLYYNSYSYTKMEIAEPVTVKPDDVISYREVTEPVAIKVVEAGSNPPLPEPVHEKGKEITVFVTESTLKATVRDLHRNGSYLAELAKVPSARVNGVQYSLQNILQYKKAAIAKAVAEAKESIEFTAIALGVELGGIKQARVDFNNDYYGPYYAKEMAYDLRSDMGMPQPQNPEKIKVRASIYLAYKVK